MSGLPDDFFSASSGLSQKKGRKSQVGALSKPKRPADEDKTTSLPKRLKPTPSVVVEVPAPVSFPVIATSTPNQLIDALRDFEQDVAAISAEQTMHNKEMVEALNRQRTETESDEQKEMVDRVGELRKRSETYKARKADRRRAQPPSGHKPAEPQSEPARDDLLDPDTVWRNRAL
uniref:Uncharacterized protein n=1 Tax=Spongospora subterranea TaxID=70186 RepID=A0A0H5QI75_9EUKA|eukprot:CRZ01312.1 hypothetical protein [Spongospora subterranea]